MLGNLFKNKARGYPAPVPELQGEIWIIQGARLGEKWSLEDGELKIGRLMDEEEAAGQRVVSFPDHCKFISGQHAIFKKQEDGYWVYDLGSKNGTTLAGKRIEKARLLDGDEVDVGQVVFKVKIHTQAQGAAARTLALAITKGPRQGETFELKAGELLVGRELVGDGVVSFPEAETSISSEHTLFRATRSGFWVQDKGSKNGTFVNGKRIENQELKDGDRVEIGSATFQVKIGA